MKKIISLLLSATTLSATVASAAYNTKADILNGLGITDPAQQAAIDNHFPFEVQADIKVRKAGEANYVDGPIVVEKDLVNALNSGQIAAAGLDVLSVEPMTEDNPLRQIKDSEKLFITPHIAWASVEARTNLMNIILGQIKEFFEQ